MGNRASVVFTNKDNTRFSPAVYLHNNGGPESIYAFLDELDRRLVRADQDYECARFIQVVADFFGADGTCSMLSLGVSNGPKSVAAEELLSYADVGDNGLYLVCRGWAGAQNDVDNPPSGPKVRATRMVRRFLAHSDYVDGVRVPSLEEKSRAWVAREHTAAYKHAYHVGNPLRKNYRTIPQEFERIAKRGKWKPPVCL